MNIDFGQNEDINNSKLKVFVSYTEACPNKKNHTFKFIQKKNFMLWPLNNLERVFKAENIYFAFEANRDCSIKIKVNFGHEQRESNKEKQADSDQGNTQDNTILISSFFKRTEDKPPQTDIIDRYIQQMGVWKRLTIKERKEK